MAEVNYRVPGLIVPVRQPSGMSCWAAMYTMMLSWRRQQSMPIRTALGELGTHYVQVFDRNSGLGIEENRNLAMAAGMTAEPLMNLTPEGWAALMRRHGLLWTSYGWQVFNSAGQEVRAGRHIVILYGISGDGTPNGTNVDYVDPSDGQTHRITFATFLGRHETGVTMRQLNRAEELGFSQIIHY